MPAIPEGPRASCLAELADRPLVRGNDGQRASPGGDPRGRAPEEGGGGCAKEHCGGKKGKEGRYDEYDNWSPVVTVAVHEYAADSRRC